MVVQRCWRVGRSGDAATVPVVMMIRMTRWKRDPRGGFNVFLAFPIVLTLSANQMIRMTRA